MTQEITLPELGENIEIVDVASVLVSEGDVVRPDQPLIEVETEKASVEVPSTAAGVVTRIHVSTGDRIRIGQVLITLEATSAFEAPSPTPSPEPSPKPGPVEAAPVPEPVAAAETPPAPTVPDEGSIRDREAARISEIGEVVPAAPSVRRLARQLGVDVGEVRGTGPRGRISMEDVKAHAKSIIAGSPVPAPMTAGGGEHPQLPDLSAFGEIEREPMSALRRAAATNLSRSWSLVPHVTQFDRADITETDSARRRYGSRVERAGGKLTVTAIAIKAAASALRVFPKFNAALDAVKQEIVLRKYVHIGVAVDTERGLVVPVIRDVDRKNVTELAVELGDVAARARERKITPDEMQGAGFTVSNLGGLGTTYFSPIVNWPEVAILGIGRADHQAVWRGESFEPRLVLPLSISYDHRLIDGSDAARFLRWTAEALEDPFLLALEG